MNPVKRKLAAFLAACMMVSMLPVSALELENDTETTENQENLTVETEVQDTEPEVQETDADDTAVKTEDTQVSETSETETDAPDTEEQVEETEVSQDTQEEESQDDVQGQDTAEEEPEDDVPEQAVDEVIYNLSNHEVTVGTDKKASQKNADYNLFASDGSYVIPLEDNAFFPYEVQFQYDGNTEVRWFDTPDSVVTVNGHAFSVATKQDDDNQFSQIGVIIDGTYIAAKPAPKQFTNTGNGVQTHSMLPLEEKDLTLDLTDYNRLQLTQVQLQTILSSDEQASTAEKVAWVKTSYSYDDDDDYKIASLSDTINLLPQYAWDDGNQHVYLNLIAGSAAQLDSSNIKYHVAVSVAASAGVFSDMQVYTQSEENERQPVPVTSDGLELRLHDTYEEYSLRIKKEVSDFYIGLTTNEAYKDYDIKLYAGEYDTAEAAQQSGKDITDQILNQDMQQTNAGYWIENKYIYDEPFTAVLTKEETTFIVPVVFDIWEANSYISSNGYLYQQQADGSRIRVTNWWDSQDSEEISNDRRYASVYTYKVDKTDEKYYIALSYHTQDRELDNTKVDYAYVGYFESEEAAEKANATNIKGALFAGNISETGGYEANYSGNGVLFTIFAEDDVFYIRIKTVVKEENEEVKISQEPIVGSSDTYFRVEGAKSATGDTLDTYIMPYSADSYYATGYQTLLVRDDTAGLLQTLKPIFWVRNPPQAYASENGEAAVKQESGESQHDFSNGPVAYTAKAENSKVSRNYWVQFVQKHTGGAQLYVNGPVDDPSNPREVFLDKIYDEKHDIFIANVGDEPLTGLNVTLTDAKNVALDEYWTIGGAKNDTLAAFTEVDEEKVANVAKIRLHPTDTVTADREISGTLTISSANGGSHTVYLTGTAGNPQIITTTVPEAVKYVPYSVMLQTNNRYDWNTVSFEKISGDLPSGVELRENGEIYGVPKQMGTFRFTVQANFSSSRFYSKTASFTLEVKDNTDDNVEDAIDAGYEINVRLPDVLKENTETTEWEIDGALSEFQDLWLDGNKLQEGSDYTADEGSTKLTIKTQTLANVGKGKHTIAGEYRNANKQLKRSAQNYSVGASSSKGNTSGSGRPSGSSKPSTSQPATSTPSTTNPSAPQQPAEPTSVYSDLSVNAWSYADVKWASEQNVMTGVGNNQFAPKSPTTQAMVIVVLARMAKADVSPYADNGQWYGQSMQWAVEKGILRNEDVQNADAVCKRGQIAVWLRNYLNVMNLSYEVNEQTLQFTDEAQMSTEEKEAFELLYKLGIFKGTGNQVMDSTGSTTREQLAVLMHRVSTFVAEHQ